jgi:hypothetical protein
MSLPTRDKTTEASRISDGGLLLFIQMGNKNPGMIRGLKSNILTTKSILKNQENVC